MAAKNPVVVVETSMGTIKIELYADKAPITVKNFLHYVDTHRLDGATFYRSSTPPGDKDEFRFRRGDKVVRRKNGKVDEMVPFVEDSEHDRPQWRWEHPETPGEMAAIASDLSDVVVRDIALPLGLVDIKVCAIDESWSGLKFVIPRDQRINRAR